MAGLLKREEDKSGQIRLASVEDVHVAWEGSLRMEYKVLSAIAARLLTLHATSCSPERIWSLLRWIYSDKRIRLAIRRAEKLLYVAMAARLERRQQAEPEDDVLLTALVDDELTGDT